MTTSAEALPEGLEAAILDLQASLPEQVERAEVINLVRLYSTLAALQHAAEAEKTTAWALAEIERAQSAVAQIRTLWHRTEAESQHIVDTLFREFKIAEDPAYRALHRALVGAMAARH